MQLTRRKLITGAAVFLAAPAVIRIATLMPVKPWIVTERIRVNSRYDDREPTGIFLYTTDPAVPFRMPPGKLLSYSYPEMGWFLTP